MDSTSRSASLPFSAVHRHHRSQSQTRQQARRKFSEDPSFQLHVRHDEHGHVAVPPPASPEVISSLITSLSVISQPAHRLFDGHPTSVSAPTTPAPGSFGVEYSAFLSPPLTNLDEERSLDDLAACPPVIRTSKPPSGFSQLTAQKSPRTPKSPSRDLSSSLRSLLRSSRPSSRGSEVSSHDDSRSVGNLSVERSGSLRRQDSQDSWGRLTGRKHRGLMYMSSKERLRASSTERKRASVGAVGGNPSGLGGSSSANSHTLGPDPFFAETPISEEPTHDDYLSSRDLPVRSPSFDTGSFPAPIPTRESSLRKTGSGTKRSSQRRPKREGDAGVNDSIPEHEEDDRARDPSASNRPSYPVRHDSTTDRRYRTDFLRADMPHSTQPNMSTNSSTKESNSPYERLAVAEDGFDDGAPFPAVHSSRRRSAHSTERRRSGKVSGRTTPEPGETLRPKRSSSRLTRLSGTKSPEPEERPAPSPEPSMNYERPKSADSVDDAVESYLCSPRLSQKIKHPQTGRVISFSEVGDSQGSAVFCCVGMGLTRYITAFYDELALTLKLRLITPDRPGVGDSEPYTDGTATPLSWPDDVYAICQALKITKFSMLAHSAGAIYALATALRMPQHIRGRIHLLAPWIPPSQMNVFGATQAMPPTNAIPTSQRILRALPTPFLKAANSSFMSATSSSLTSSLPKTQRRTNKRKSSARPGSRGTPWVDKDGLANPLEADRPEDRLGLPYASADPLDPIRARGAAELAVLDAAADALADQERQTVYDNRLTHAIWDLATTGANPAVDLLVCLERRHTIGFRYVDITRPVVLHHGSRDTRVPVENVKWLGKTMRRCEVRVLEGEGHGLMASASVMSAVLMEISKEWEDWMRVTGTTRRDGERERGRSSRAGVR